MNLKLLDKELISDIYNRYMVNDFPEDELKPLEIILNAVEEGFYFCYGLLDGDNIYGYIYLESMPQTKDYLIDYLAVVKGYRNSGYGSQMIRLLGEVLADATAIVAEVENPEYASSVEEKAIQNKRYEFYIRNGFRDTGVRVRCFGVPFILIETGEGLFHSQDDMRILYNDLYKAILPQELYEGNIEV